MPRICRCNRVAKDSKIERADAEIEEIAQRTLLELERKQRAQGLFEIRLGTF